MNINLKQDLGLDHIYKNMNLRLESCTVTSYADNDYSNPVTMTIIDNQCPTSLGLADIVYSTDSEIEFVYQNYQDKRHHQSLVTMKCEVCKYNITVNLEGT